MQKVKLNRGYFYIDAVTGWSIAYGEIKEASDDIIARAGSKLKVLVELEGENE
ncbi:MAG: hypothetical protein H5T45_01520 [Thermoplasmatales archaeon]|nr:hypothetical protein [Thermoplasmatales archaeon]